MNRIFSVPDKNSGVTDASPLDIQTIRTIRELECLQAEWERCYREDRDACPYASFDWFYCLALKILKEEDLRICVVRKEGRSIAILPFAVGKKELSLPYTRRKITAYSFLHFPLYFAVRKTAIIVPEARKLPILDAALSHLFAQEENVLSARLDIVPSESPLLASPATGFRIDKATEGRSVIIELPDSWARYSETLSPVRKKKIAQTIKGVRKAGETRLARLGLGVAYDRAAVDRLIEDALAVSRKSWQGNATSGIAISDEPVVDFVWDVSHRLASRGELDLSVLYLNSEPISFVWGAARWPYMTIAKLGFDPAYHKLSPGTAHLAMLLEDSIKRGVKAIDFGHEFPDYKSRWSKNSEELATVTFYPQTISASALQWAHRLNAMCRSASRQTDI